MDEREHRQPTAARNRGEIAALRRDLLIDSVDEQGTRVIALRGELDLASAPKLERELEAALEDAGGPIVIDLSELDFMDSTGLRTLIMGQRRASERERPFAIARRPGEFVARVFQLAGADEAFALYDARNAALTAVAG
jgi:anti-sigma B factor antagonist